MKVKIVKRDDAGNIPFVSGLLLKTGYGWRYSDLNDLYEKEFPGSGYAFGHPSIFRFSAVRTSYLLDNQTDTRVDKI